MIDIAEEFLKSLKSGETPLHPIVVWRHPDKDIWAAAFEGGSKILATSSTWSGLIDQLTDHFRGRNKHFVIRVIG